MTETFLTVYQVSCAVGSSKPSPIQPVNGRPLPTAFTLMRAPAGYASRGASSFTRMNPVPEGGAA